MYLLSLSLLRLHILHILSIGSETFLLHPNENVSAASSLPVLHVCCWKNLTSIPEFEWARIKYNSSCISFGLSLGINNFSLQEYGQLKKNVFVLCITQHKNTVCIVLGLVKFCLLF